MPKFEAKKGDFAKIWQKLGGGAASPPGSAAHVGFSSLSFWFLINSAEGKTRTGHLGNIFSEFSENGSKLSLTLVRPTVF